MIGTIVNTTAIIVGTIAGSMLHRGIKQKYKTTLYDALGLASLAIGLNATITHFPKSQYPVLFIVALAVGGVIGTRLDIDGRFHRLVDRKQRAADGEPGDAGNGEQVNGEQANGLANGEQVNGRANEQHSNGQVNGRRGSLADGLATAILLYCIGPLSMLGPVISALKGDHTFLFTNATLDFVSSTIFASTYGMGMILAAPVLFCWQGMFYLVAQLSSTALSEALMAELLIVGGLMITGSGLSLLNLKDCKVLNLLPALLVPILWFIVCAVV